MTNNYHLIKKQELIIKFRVITGWSEDKIIEELKSVSCNYWIALDVYKAAARLPNENDCDLIKRFGFDAWYLLFQMSLKSPNGLR